MVNERFSINAIVSQFRAIDVASLVHECKIHLLESAQCAFSDHPKTIGFIDFIKIKTFLKYLRACAICTYSSRAKETIYYIELSLPTWTGMILDEPPKPPRQCELRLLRGMVLVAID